MKIIKKRYFIALKEQMRLEAYQCGRFGECKDEYRVSYCKKASEYVVQLKEDNGSWLCLHD